MRTSNAKAQNVLQSTATMTKACLLIAWDYQWLIRPEPKKIIPWLFIWCHYWFIFQTHRQLSKPDNISEVCIVKHSACLGEYILLPQCKCHDKAIKCVRRHQVFQSYVSFFKQARNAVAVFLVLSLPPISFLSLLSSTCGLNLIIGKNVNLESSFVAVIQADFHSFPVDRF